MLHRDALRDAHVYHQPHVRLPSHPHTHILIPKSRSHLHMASHTS
jgi:hypothetical protein